MSGSVPKPKIGPSKEFRVPGSYRSGPAGYGSGGAAASARTQAFRDSLYAHQPQPTPGTYQVRKPVKVGRVKLWIRRNPYKFQAISLTLGLGIFFSKPIYDIFFKEAKVGPRPLEERRKL